MAMAYHEGQRVGKYRLIESLVSKGVGEVYLAEDIDKENVVTVRLLGGWTQEEFLRRAEWLTRLKHRNILPILDYGKVYERDQWYSSWYVVTEYIPNGHFRDHYPKGKILFAETTVPFVRQITSAIQYLDDNSFFLAFLHTKLYMICPNNMLLGHSFEILLTGFEDALFLQEGVAYRIDDLPISYLYASPESFEGSFGKVGIQYSLACTIYEWLCGNTPFHGNSFEQLREQHSRTAIPPSLHEKNSAVPEAVSGVVMKALAKKPEDRYESIMAFADAFERAVMGKRSDGIGEQFGKYVAVHLLEEGEMWRTYLGLGVPEPDVFKGLVVIIASVHWLSREFSDKAQQLQQLQHPNILRILDYGKNLSFYLIMDYARGGNLRDLSSIRPLTGTILPLKTIVTYVKQIAAALQYVHDAHFTHRYVWPKNIFVGKNGELLLGGFEYQFVDWVDWYEERMSIGEDYYKATYGSPEFNLRDKAIPASDQYSLAIVVYEWLCSDVPFHDIVNDSVEIMIQHDRVTPPSLREKNPAIPHEVEAVVMKALSKKPEKRYETIQDFADALEEAITSDTDKTGKYRMPDRSGEQFGQYRLVRLLGQGGFAEVYLGQHIKLETFAAIKVLHTQLSAKELEAFEKEAKVIASLKHPSIVRVFDYNAERKVPFLVMDHAPEGTMRQFHARGSRLSLPLVVKYVKQIADALQYAHNQKIIHRDVKPANMLIMSSDTVMLSDFGLAVIAHSERSWRVQDKAGTAQYMAPEQFRGKAVPASDQYSLAVTAYEWLCGAPPFDEGDEIQLGYQHAHEAVSTMSERGAMVSKGVEQVIMKALEKEPTNRFGSVKEFAEALEKAAQAEQA